MSIYLCNRCQEKRDNDVDFCSPDPKRPHELICEGCMTDALHDDDDSEPPVNGKPS